MLFGSNVCIWRLRLLIRRQSQTGFFYCKRGSSKLRGGEGALDCEQNELLNACAKGAQGLMPWVRKCGFYTTFPSFLDFYDDLIKKLQNSRMSHINFAKTRNLNMLTLQSPLFCNHLSKKLRCLQLVYQGRRCCFYVIYTTLIIVKGGSCHIKFVSGFKFLRTRGRLVDTFECCRVKSGLDVTLEPNFWPVALVVVRNVQKFNSKLLKAEWIVLNLQNCFWGMGLVTFLSRLPHFHRFIGYILWLQRSFWL